MLRSCRHPVKGGVRVFFALFTLLLILIPSIPLKSQSLATLKGTVTDSKGAGVADAQVVLLTADKIEVDRTETDSDGKFIFKRLAPGQYALVVEKASFEELRQEIELHPSQQVASELKLLGGPNSQTSHADHIHGSSHLLSRHASRSELENLQAEVEQLRATVDQLLKERRASKATENQQAIEPRKGTPELTEASQAEVSTQVSSEPSVLGRGRTDLGLYNTLAAGGQGTRYGRSIYGDLVRIGGYGSFRFESNTLDSLPQAGTLPVPQRGNNGFNFRRFVLTTDVNPTDRIRFYSEIEFERFGKIEVERRVLPENRGPENPVAGTRFVQSVEGTDGSELSVEQAWAEFNLTKNLAIRGGIILPPLGRFNILHDDDYWDVPRRTLVDRDIPVIPVRTAWSEGGIGVIGTQPLAKGFLNYQFYGVNGVTLNYSLEQSIAIRDDKAEAELEPEIFFDSGPVNGTRGLSAVTWRLGYVPKIGNEIALSGYNGKYTPSWIQQSGYLNSFGLDGKFTHKGFEVEGEFIYTDYGKMQRVENDMARNLVESENENEGGEVSTEIAVALKGPFTDQRYGFWTDFKYRFRPKWVKESILGKHFDDPQIIPVVRYERIWLNNYLREFDFRAGMVENAVRENLSQDRLTLGLTYRPIPSMPISFAYQFNQRRNGTTMFFPDSTGLGQATDQKFGSLLLGFAIGF